MNRNFVKITCIVVVGVMALSVVVGGVSMFL